MMRQRRKGEMGSNRNQIRIYVLGIPGEFGHEFGSPIVWGMEMGYMYKPFQIQARYTMDPTIAQPVLIPSPNHLK